MNSNQVKGKAKDIGGKIQEGFGKATGNVGQQIKGGAKQVEGKIQKGVGDVQEAADRAQKKTR
ncbi:MAG: CsbD family protein [Betaproteobacteria bacterium]